MEVVWTASKLRHIFPEVLFYKGKKGSPKSNTKHRVLKLILDLGSQPAGDASHKPGCHYFPPGLQLPPQPLIGLLPILLLGKQKHNGCEQLA